jgi:SLIDE
VSKQNEDDSFTEQEDKFISYCLYKYGYNNWDLMKNEIRNSNRFRFNWRFLSKTTIDLQKRSDYLIDLFKEELEESKPKTRNKKVVSQKLKPIQVHLKQTKPSKQKPKTNSRPKFVESESEDEAMNDSKSDQEDENYKTKVATPENTDSNRRPTRNRKVVNYKEN